MNAPGIFLNNTINVAKNTEVYKNILKQLTWLAIDKYSIFILIFLEPGSIHIFKVGCFFHK